MQNFQVIPIGKINANEEGVFIELEPKYIPAMQALDGFSHLSVIWWFTNKIAPQFIIPRSAYTEQFIHCQFLLIRKRIVQNSENAQSQFG